MTLPSTVTIKLGGGAFVDCSNLSGVILLGDKRLLNRNFLARGVFNEENRHFSIEEQAIGRSYSMRRGISLSIVDQ